MKGIDRVGVDVRICGLLVLVLSAIFFDVLLLGNNFYTRDLTSYHYPMKKVVRDAMVEGRLPEWNPYFAGGQPLAANPAYEVFYPPQWITLIPDYNLGFRLHILFHAYLAAIGAYLFLRSLRVGPFVAFAGAATFVMSGPFSSVFNLLPFMFSVAWTPWVALFAVRYFGQKRRRDLVALILCLAMQVLICEPTTLLQTWFVLGAWATYRGAIDSPTGRKLQGATSGLVASVCVVVAALFTSAVQFLPALDHASDSVRAVGFDWEVVSDWSLPPLRVIEMLYPSFFGILETGGPHYWGASLYPRTNPFLYSIYIGVLFASLAIAGVVRRRRGAGFVLGLSVVSFVLAFGAHTPVLRFLHDWNLLPSIRYPEKFVLMGVFALLTWSCLLLEDILRGDSASLRVALTTLVVSSVLAMALFSWGFTPGYREWFLARWDGSTEWMAAAARVHWLIAVARGLAFAVALWLVFRTRSRASRILLVGLLLADLAPLGNQINPRMPRRFFDEPLFVASVKQLAPDGRLVNLPILEEGKGRFAGVNEVSKVFWGLRNGLTPLLPAAWQIPMFMERDVDETHLIHTREFQELAMAYLRQEPDQGSEWNSRAVEQLALLCNVGAVVASKDETIDWDGDPEVIRPARLMSVAAGDRYYFAKAIRIVSDPLAMFRDLVDRGVARDIAYAYDDRAVAGWGRVLTLDESPERIEIEVEALGNATLVASVTRHKYWSATIDEQRVPILPIDHVFQGVVVPPGRHVVVFEYRNPLLATGAAMTLTMLFGLLGSVFRGTGTRRWVL